MSEVWELLEQRDEHWGPSRHQHSTPCNSHERTICCPQKGAPYPLVHGSKAHLPRLCVYACVHSCIHTVGRKVGCRVVPAQLSSPSARISSQS